MNPLQALLGAIIVTAGAVAVGALALVFLVVISIPIAVFILFLLG